MNNDLPKRKSNRIAEYDYSQCNVYFLTLCTKDRLPLFWTAGAVCGGLHDPLPLSAAGKTVQTELNRLSEIYPSVQLDTYTIMPDHIHLLVRINADSDGRPQVAPTVSRLVQQLKGTVSKKMGAPIWQKSFYDHVVRHDVDYLACWQYIENNPMKIR